ncbi:[Fe-S]-binding protein, partial [Acetobacter malorum]
MVHSSPLHHDDVARVLDSVRDAQTGHSLLALSKLDGFRLEEGRLSVALAVSKEQAATLAPLCNEAKPALEKLPGVQTATVILTAHRAPSAPGAAPS